MTRSARLADLINIPQATLEKSLTLSTEAIAHQVESPLFKELTAALEPLTAASPLSAWYKADLESIIKKHTGLTFRIEYVERVINACAFIPDLSPTDIFGGNFKDYSASGHDGKRIVKSRLEKLGKVDIAKSRVSGLFEKLVFKIVVGTGLMWKPFTAPEVAGVVLHEVGHVFTALEYAHELMSTNIILHDVIERIKGTDDKAIRIELIETAMRDLDLTEEPAVIDKLADTTDGRLFYVAVNAYRSERLRSTTGADWYGGLSCEAAADQFAARHGAQKHLVSFHFKCEKEYPGEYSELDRKSFLAWSMFRYAFVGVLSLMFPFFGFISFMVWINSVGNAAERFEGAVYDTLKDRIARIRRELISAMKDPALPVSIRKTYEKDLADIDQMESQVVVNSFFVDKVWLFLSKRTRTQKTRAAVHQLIEEMANNRLFSSANSLFHRGE